MVREAVVQDMEAVRALTGELEDRVFDSGRFDRVFRSKLASPDDLILVWCAGTSGDPCGYIHLRIEEQLHHEGEIAEIMELVVGSAARGGGVGGELLGVAVARARERCCEQIELTSNARRLRAHAFYERHGFEKTHVKLVKGL